MRKIKKFVKQLYSHGHPLLMDDGYWHVCWYYAGSGESDGTGKSHITSFGWKDIEMAKAHIANVMAG